MLYLLCTRFNILKNVMKHTIFTTFCDIYVNNAFLHFMRYIELPKMSKDFYNTLFSYQNHWKMSLEISLANFDFVELCYQCLLNYLERD